MEGVEMTIAQYGGWIAVASLVSIILLGGLLTRMGVSPQDPESPGWKFGGCLGTLLIIILLFGLAVAGIGLVLSEMNEVLLLIGSILALLILMAFIIHILSPFTTAKPNGNDMPNNEREMMKEEILKELKKELGKENHD